MRRMVPEKMASTAIFTRARFLFICSTSEPWGMNGFGLFMSGWRWLASFLVRLVWFGFLRRGFASKNPDARLNLFFQFRRSRLDCFSRLSVYWGVPRPAHYLWRPPDRAFRVETLLPRKMGFETDQSSNKLVKSKSRRRTPRFARSSSLFLATATAPRKE